MKSSAASGKNGKSAIVVFTCTCRILQVMLPHSRKKSFSYKTSDWLARAGQFATVLRNVILKNGFRHVLLDPLLQTLGSTTHVLTITVAQKLVKNLALI